MIVHQVGNSNSILNKFIAEIRDEAIQKDSLRFRRNIERIGEVLGYEFSKSIDYERQAVKTPLGIKNTYLPSKKIVICSILRAGLPLHQGLLNYFDDSENAFVAAYRHHPKNNTNFEIMVEYFASPAMKGKTLLLADPMLATGQSLIAVYEAIKKQRTIDQVHIISVIGSSEGIKNIKDHFPVNTQLCIAAIDDQLNDKGYIVPGLGDAGDLAFGIKL
jgi:uracil phosphoribosyltransferase